MEYTIHVHPALSVLRGRMRWRREEMLSELITLDEEIRLDRFFADGTIATPGTGHREGGVWSFVLKEAQEYLFEYSVPLGGKTAERDFLLLSSQSPLLPRVETKGEVQVQLLLPQSYSAQSSLKRQSLAHEDGVKRYHFRGEGEWCLALARYVELPFLTGKLLLLKEGTAVMALRALEEAMDVLARWIVPGGKVRMDIAGVPEGLKGKNTPGGVFIEERAFHQLSSLPLLMERFFALEWLPRSPGEEEGYIEHLVSEYFVSETLQRVLSRSQLASLGVSETTLLREIQEFLGAEAFDKLLGVILQKYEGAILSKTVFQREFDELAWKPGTGAFLKERM